MRLPIAALILSTCTALLSSIPAQAVELHITRSALERTLRQQLFGTPDGRYYISGNAHSACPVYAEDATVTFQGERIVVDVQTHAKIGKSLAGLCVGLSLSPNAEVSMLPDAEGETIGFRDARVERISDSHELNFILMPFLGHKIPSSMKVNAADILRKALADSTRTTGYQLTLDHLKIHSMQVEGDALVVDVDGGLTVK